jgi:hypothetical protein
LKAAKLPGKFFKIAAVALERATATNRGRDKSGTLFEGKALERLNYESMFQDEIPVK